MQDIQTFLTQRYGLYITAVKPMTTGVGGKTYFIQTNEGKYVFKTAEHDGMNHPENEPGICRYLLNKGIRVPKYIRNLEGETVTAFDKNSFCHVQTFIEGEHYAVHTAPDWLMKASALALANIHLALAEFPPLPAGIGNHFFTFMTPERAAFSFRKSLERAKDLGRSALADDLAFRLELVSKIKPYPIDMSQLTVCNTHGDYTINQLICTKSSVCGIVDWTCACRHPVVWELARSFAYAEPSCRDGAMVPDKLEAYLSEYESVFPLKKRIESIFCLYTCIS